MTTIDPHRHRQGGLDPTPPDPGAVDKGWPPHIVLALALCVGGFVFALILDHESTALHYAPLALLIVAAGFAWPLSRREPRHRAVFVALLVLATACVGTALLAAAFPPAGPYVGWRRVPFHVGQALTLAIAAVPALLAIRIFVVSPGFLRWAGGALVTTYIGAWGACVTCYHEIRGDVLRQFYLLAEIAGLFVGACAIGSWLLRRGWRRDVDPSVDNALDRVEDAMGPRMRKAFGEIVGEPPPRITIVCTLALVAAPLALLLVGAWRYGLWGPAYAVQQAGLLALYGALAGAQAWALWSGRAGK